MSHTYTVRPKETYGDISNLGMANRFEIKSPLQPVSNEGITWSKLAQELVANKLLTESGYEFEITSEGSILAVFTVQTLDPKIIDTRITELQGILSFVMSKAIYTQKLVQAVARSTDAGLSSHEKE